NLQIHVALLSAAVPQVKGLLLGTANFTARRRLTEMLVPFQVAAQGLKKIVVNIVLPPATKENKIYFFHKNLIKVEREIKNRKNLNCIIKTNSITSIISGRIEPGYREGAMVEQNKKKLGPNLQS
ncbi:hypothetical protein ACJX0J_015322, partial [Zea mays]